MAALHFMFPPPRRNVLIRAARKRTWQRRYRAIVRRYENTAGVPRAA
jgi:hypothetical protein